MSEIYDEVRLLKSKATGKTFPHIVFSGDTDMVTVGWVSLTSIEATEVVAAKTTPDEWRAISKGISGYSLVEARINKQLKRSDLRCSWLVRVEEVGPALASLKGLSFQEFRGKRVPPKNLYRDIFDPSSEADEVSIVSRSEFEGGGGKLLVVS